MVYRSAPNPVELILALWFVINVASLFGGILIGWYLSQRKLNNAYKKLLEFYDDLHREHQNLKCYR